MKSKKLEKQILLQAEQELLSMYRKNNVEDKTHMYEFIKKYKNENYQFTFSCSLYIILFLCESY